MSYTGAAGSVVPQAAIKQRQIEEKTKTEALNAEQKNSKPALLELYRTQKVPLTTIQFHSSFTGPANCPAFICRLLLPPTASFTAQVKKPCHMPAQPHTLK